MQYRAAADVFSSGAAFRSLPTDGLVDVSTDGEAAANASTKKRYEGAFFFGNSYPDRTGVMLVRR
ncbi:hypothetical protein KGP93_39775, partial [Burkholderia multivorans]|nr:hypothetical protein [Burkholderia multivorans]